MGNKGSKTAQPKGSGFIFLPSVENALSILDATNPTDASRAVSSAFPSVWHYTKPVLDDYSTPTDAQIKSYLKQIYDPLSKKLYSHSSSLIPIEICSIIALYLPINNNDKSHKKFQKSFILPKKASDTAVERYYSYCIAYISRFLKGISMIDPQFKQHCTQSHAMVATQFRQFYKESIATNTKLPKKPFDYCSFLIDFYIEDITWFVLGGNGYNYGNQVTFPPKPYDIIGRLKDGLGCHWFYYKDGKADFYGGHGINHESWCYFVGDSLEQLFAQMDTRDIERFIQKDKKSRPLAKK